MEWFYLVMLFAAIFVNLSDAKMIGLCFVVGWFLLLIPRALLDGGSLQIYWFLMLAALEACFAVAAYSMRCHASKTIAWICALNIATHGFAAAFFRSFGYTPAFHHHILHAGELCQIFSLLVYSSPSVAWFDNALSKYKRREKRNEPTRMVETVC